MGHSARGPHLALLGRASPLVRSPRLRTRGDPVSVRPGRRGCRFGREQRRDRCRRPRALEPPSAPGNARAGAGAPPGGASRGRGPQSSLRAQLLALEARACARSSPRRCLAVSMATKSIEGGSGKEKMKLKSLLLRYYPPGTGRGPFRLRVGSLALGGSGAEEAAGTPGAGGGGVPYTVIHVGDKKQGTTQPNPPLLRLLGSVPGHFQNDSFRKPLNVEVTMLFSLVRNVAGGEGEGPRYWFPEGKKPNKDGTFHFKRPRMITSRYVGYEKNAYSTEHITWVTAFQTTHSS